MSEIMILLFTESCGRTESSFLSAITIPVRERSNRKRVSTQLTSYLLTSDTHMTTVAEKAAKNKTKVDKRPKSKSGRQIKNKSASERTDVGLAAKGKQKPKQSKDSSKAGSKSKDTTECGHCGIMYGETNDARINDEWVRCQGCCKWYHETCAEIVGLLDDTAFTCKSCI
jgi:hypothetical protein